MTLAALLCAANAAADEEEEGVKVEGREEECKGETSCKTRDDESEAHKDKLDAENDEDENMEENVGKSDENSRQKSRTISLEVAEPQSECDENDSPSKASTPNHVAQHVLSSSSSPSVCTDPKTAAWLDKARSILSSKCRCGREHDDTHDHDHADTDEEANARDVELQLKELERLIEEGIMCAQHNHHPAAHSNATTNAGGFQGELGTSPLLSRGTVKSVSSSSLQEQQTNTAKMDATKNTSNTPTSLCSTPTKPPAITDHSPNIQTTPKPTTTTNTTTSTPPLRRGKWTIEEEDYVAQMVRDFNRGFLTDAKPGTTLRSYLSEKLHCDPMRITKKFTGEACIGKRVFHPALVSSGTGNTTAGVVAGGTASAAEGDMMHAQTKPEAKRKHKRKRNIHESTMTNHKARKKKHFKENIEFNHGNQGQNNLHAKEDQEEEEDDQSMASSCSCTSLVSSMSSSSSTISERTGSNSTTHTNTMQDSTVQTQTQTQTTTQPQPTLAQQIAQAQAELTYLQKRWERKLQWQDMEASKKAAEAQAATAAAAAASLASRSGWLGGNGSARRGSLFLPPLQQEGQGNPCNNRNNMVVYPPPPEGVSKEVYWVLIRTAAWLCRAHETLSALSPSQEGGVPKNAVSKDGGISVPGQHSSSPAQSTSTSTHTPPPTTTTPTPTLALVPHVPTSHVILQCHARTVKHLIDEGTELQGKVEDWVPCLMKHESVNHQHQPVAVAAGGAGGALSSLGK